VIAGVAGDRELGWALRALCLTEIVSWGVLYYAFPVLAPAISADTGWSAAALTGVFSAALVVAAITGIPVGRLIHRYGPRWVMTAGSVLAVAALVLIAAAPSPWVFAAGWLLAGAAMSGVLYAPAFAALTVWFGEDRVRALTAVTLVAGLASTVFAPVTALLDAHLSWRGSYLVLAGILAVLTIPAHAVALRPAWPHHPSPDAPAPPPRGEADPLPPPAARPVIRREFWMLATAYTASSLCAYAVIINVIPLLHARGHSGTAASWVLGIGGVGQVLGRLGYARLSRHTGLTTRTVAVFAATTLTTGLLAAVPGPYLLLVAIALVAGYARGLATLLSATAVSDRWGTSRYARLNGVFTAPLMAASALAPFLGAALAALLGGYPAAFAALTLLGAAGTALATTPGSRPRNTST
jgi:MFS family permease